MPRILVIDDNEQVRAVIRAMLEGEGYVVEEASNGIMGIGIFRDRPADLVITDIVMPEKDGFETIMELWRDFPDVRVIAVSGSPHVIDVATNLECARAFGAIRTFIKPIDRQTLVDAVCELVGPAR